VPHADKNWSAKPALTINRMVLAYRPDARRPCRKFLPRPLAQSSPEVAVALELDAWID
jgi:hypothetical protein